MRHRFFGAALIVTGGKHARDGGALGGPGWSGAGVAAVRMSLLDTPGNERMHRLSRLKSYTTQHLSVGVGRSVALSNTHMVLNTHTGTHMHAPWSSCTL